MAALPPAGAALAGRRGSAHERGGIRDCDVGSSLQREGLEKYVSVQVSDQHQNIVLYNYRSRVGSPPEKSQVSEIVR